MTILRVAVAPAVVVLLASFLQSDQVLPPIGAAQDLIAEKGAECAPADKEDVVNLALKRAAWRAPVGQKWTVVINGVPVGSPADEVRSLYFSPGGASHAPGAIRQAVDPDGGRPAHLYAVRRGAWSRVQPRHHPAGLRRQTGRTLWRLVEGEHESPVTYADLHLPRFSADGRRVAFGAKPDKKWILILDGAPQQKQFDDIVAVSFSPEGAGRVCRAPR